MSTAARPSPGGLAAVREIRLPAPEHAALLAHARRKLRGEHLPGETEEGKAFGLLTGRVEGPVAHVHRAVALARNLRHEQPYKAHIDALVHELAVPSTTPLERRGWLADPAELLAVQAACDRDGTEIVGSYHMHRVGWPQDPRRETCTALDTALARESRLFMMVLSMVEPDRPVLRAFYEGDNEREARVVVTAATSAGPADPAAAGSSRAAAAATTDGGGAGGDAGAPAAAAVGRG